MQEFDALKARAERAKRWLISDALPLWWNVGFDRGAACFHEKIGLDGAPTATPRRVRVQARQTFVYAAAGRLGWNGPWRDAVAAGVSVLLARGLRADGGTAHTLDTSGAPADMRRDLYDTAFVIFACVHAGAVLDRKDWIDAGARLSDWTFETWTSPQGGLREGDVTPTPPRRQNPHMHMLEAMLALYEASGDPRFLARARTIVDLFRAHFFSPNWGALLEYFNDDWTPRTGDEGRICEPGHQFEWAWLLDRYQRHTADDTSAEASRLYAHGEKFGVDAAGYAVDEVWADDAPRTPTARLWPQTERIKANIIRVEKTQSREAAAAAVQACDALETYMQTPIPGMWRDRRRADGGFIEEPAPASSFYHIMVAYLELIRVAETL